MGWLCRCVERCLLGTSGLILVLWKTFLVDAFLSNHFVWLCLIFHAFCMTWSKLLSVNQVIIILLNLIPNFFSHILYDWNLCMFETTSGLFPLIYSTWFACHNVRLVMMYWRYWGSCSSFYLFVKLPSVTPPFYWCAFLHIHQWYISSWSSFCRYQSLTLINLLQV